MKKILVGLFLSFAFFAPNALVADQFFGGVGLNPASGQPNYVADGFMNINLAYESARKSLAGWRFSYTMTNFKHRNSDTLKIKSQILAAEQLFVAKIKPGLSLIGAFGPGLFITSVESGSSRSGTGIGLSATGSIRFALTRSVFLGAAYHYKNCAVKIDNGTVDGGYQGLYLNVGAFF